MHCMVCTALCPIPPKRARLVYVYERPLSMAEYAVRRENYPLKVGHVILLAVPHSGGGKNERWDNLFTVQMVEMLPGGRSKPRCFDS